MSIDEKTIRETLLKGERVTLECKKAQSNVPVDAWKTYSAFANTYGGLILLGVYEDLKEKDISKRFTITGVDDAAKIRKDFWNIVNNPEKVNVNLLKDEDVETVELEGKNVVAIRVPMADYNTRPVYINNNPLRAGAETRARNQRIQNMFRMIGFGENLGSGFPLILSAWNEKHWLKPELIEQRELMQVKLVLSIETKNETVNATANATVNATVKLSKTQKRILPIIQENKYATYEEIAKQLDIERTTVWRNLDAMKKNGVVNRIGGDKNGYWEVLLDIKE